MSSPITCSFLKMPAISINIVYYYNLSLDSTARYNHLLVILHAECKTPDGYYRDAGEPVPFVAYMAFPLAVTLPLASGVVQEPLPDGLLEYTT